MSCLAEYPIEQVKGVGARRAAGLKEAGIHTVKDLLYYLPRRYVDRSTILPAARAPVGREVTLIGRVRRSRFVPGAHSRFVLEVEDESGDIHCVWFRGGSYLRHTFREGDILALSGKVERFQGRLQMRHPEYEFVAAEGGRELLHTGGMVPLYAASAEMKERGLRSRNFRRLMRTALEEYLDELGDALPEARRRRLGLPELGESLRAVHFPQSAQQLRLARRRLAFDELFALQLRLARRRARRLARRDGMVCKRSERLVPALLASLPFEPTGAQRRAMAEIAGDMAQPCVMSRLLQGEVGAGKTLVALSAMLAAVESGYQAALMAPTEILAEQHFLTIQAQVEPLGLSAMLLRGRQGTSRRRGQLGALAGGAARLVVGTHALIQEQVAFHCLGLAVVDEQHRFGVVQRAELYNKGQRPDLLLMTATPIPRTLALTLYGDLDVSVLDELPSGRKPVRTALRPSARRGRIFAFAAEQMRQGHQVYVVYPLIEESEKMDLKSAVEGYEELRRGWLRDFEVALLHGRMVAEEKAGIMARFRRGQIQALVSTTVIEVGMDVANATVMIIEQAERFGLAQLHQLRGRVGRGAAQAYCILVAGPGAGSEAAEGWRRLEALCATQDGFELAQRDLELRGPGELLGRRQAGIPEFSAADPIRDVELLALARREARRVVAEEGETPRSFRERKGNGKENTAGAHFQE